MLTVSPNYASEITSSPAKGVELDSAIRSMGGAIGIVNGMDTDVSGAGGLHWGLLVICW